MKCSSGGRDIRENASYCSDCGKEAQGSEFNEQEMTEIWRELKDYLHLNIISVIKQHFGSEAIGNLGT